MKTANDPRHRKRIEKVKALYTYSFSGVASKDIEEIVEKLPEIDARIAQAAPERPVTDMNKVDLAIVREGVFELLGGGKKEIVIDEMVEIAKVFGADSTPKFVNATLNTIAHAL